MPIRGSWITMAGWTILSRTYKNPRLERPEPQNHVHRRLPATFGRGQYLLGNTKPAGGHSHRWLEGRSFCICTSPADPGNPSAAAGSTTGQHNGLGRHHWLLRDALWNQPYQDPEAHCGGYSFCHPWRHAMRGGSQSDYWRDHVSGRCHCYGCAQAI